MERLKLYLVLINKTYTFKKKKRTLMVAFKAYLDNLPISKCLILSNLQSLFFGLYTLAGSRN